MRMLSKWMFWAGWLVLHGAQAAVVGPASGTVGGAEPATVLEVNPSGLGHVNLVPYFSTHSNFDTHVHLANTDTVNGKAVKLRWRSAVNGQDIGNFTVLLAPGDMLALSLTRDAATGYARIVHNDRSCTLPAGARGLLGPTTARKADGSLAEDPSLTQEGSMEIITLADIPPTSSLFAVIKRPSPQTAPSCSASALRGLEQDSISYADAQSKGLEVPTTGLTTKWFVINVPNAVAYSGRATALEARVGPNGKPGYGNIVFFPQTGVAVPDMQRAASYSISPYIRGGLRDPAALVTGFSPAALSYVENQLPDLSTPYLPVDLVAGQPTSEGAARQAQSVDAALAVASIGGDVLREPSIAAKTDWVITQPTLYLRQGTAAFAPLCALAFGRPWPSTSPWPAGVPAPNPRNATSFRSYEAADVWIGEGQIEVATPGPIVACGASSILRFVKADDADNGGALGTQAATVRPIFTDTSGAWGRIETPGQDGIGLPAIGFIAVELYNGSVKPVISGFGLTYPLITTRP